MVLKTPDAANTGKTCRCIILTRHTDTAIFNLGIYTLIVTELERVNELTGKVIRFSLGMIRSENFNVVYSSELHKLGGLQ